MILGNKRMTSLVSCIIAATLLVPGCSKPAPPSKGEPVGLSVREEQTHSSGIATQEQTVGAISKQEMATVIPAEAKMDSQDTIDKKPDNSSSIESKTSDQVKETDKVSDKQPTTNLAPTEPVKENSVPQVTQKENTISPVIQKENPSVKVTKEHNKVPTLTFQDLYSDMTVRGVKISDQVNQLSGKKVEMIGFMAPPLTAKVNFFVLTKVALTICPFCSTDADWPTDIVVIFMPKGKDITPTEHQVKVTGTLSVGSQTDEATGFVSIIRIKADKVEVLK